MPIHQQTSNGHPTKPLMPALSSRFRNGKSPITPKLSGSPQASPTLSQRSPDRNARPNNANTAREEISPLTANVTPRSGNRRSRIGDDSPATPSGVIMSAFTRARAASGGKKIGEGNALSGTGLGISSPSARPYTAPRVLQNNINSASSPNLSRTRRISMTKSGVGSEDSSLTSPFFHADDAKSSISSYDMPERPKLGPKAATFFYVGSGNIIASADLSRPNVSTSSPRPDAAKFFHADDLPESSPKPQPQRPTLNKKQSTASIGSPRLQSPDLQRKSKSPSRPASPLKDVSYRSAPPTLSSPPKNKPTSTPVLTARLDATKMTRRTSVGSNIATPRQPLHKKSSSTHIPSTTAIKTPSSPRAKPPLPDLRTSPTTAQQARLSKDITSPTSTSPRSTSLSSMTTIPTSVSTRPPSEANPVSLASPSLSPSKPPDPSTATKQPSLPLPASEAAANARRERKVLDLEISNSSLLAINRTLEREMRKQAAELRRFRRLSRSGRLSIRSLSAQSKNSLGALVEEDSDEGDAEARELLQGLDNMDLGESDDEISESDDDGDDDDVSNLSPTASASSTSNLGSTQALRRRRKDEKRLLLDLSKHRQLLIDSEKMNSSIRRCLGWSEEMIVEAKKALAYSVKVGDVKLGGRVLIADHEDSGSEEEGGGSGGRAMGLVSPSRILTEMEVDGLWEHAEEAARRRDEGMSPVLGGLETIRVESPEGFDELP